MAANRTVLAEFGFQSRAGEESSVSLGRPELTAVPLTNYEPSGPSGGIWDCLTQDGSYVLHWQPEPGVPTGEFDAIELDASALVGTRALVRWRNRGDGERPIGQVQARIFQAQESSGAAPSQGEGEEALVGPAPAAVACRLKFDLAPEPGFSGHPEELLIELPEGARPSTLRMLQLGFIHGDEPLDRAGSGDSNPNGSAGDGGLIALGRDARRAWPADWDSPLIADVTLPRGAKLSVAVATTRGSLAAGESVQLLCELREAGKGWRPMGKRELKDAEDRWQPWVVDLSAFAGREVTLALRAVRGTPRTLPAILSESRQSKRARVLWATPMVLGEPIEDRKPDIVLVTLDTLRGDEPGFAGGRAPTPFLDRLASEGLVFESAWSSTNSTQPSHASILTGLALQDHGVVDNYSAVPREVTTLAEELRARGYHTVAAVSQPCLGLGCGFGQGFDQFLQPASDSHLDGASTLQGIEAWCEEWSAAGERPLFLWLHLYDPHTPYVPPEEFMQSYTAEHGPLPPKQADPASMPVLDVVPADMEFLLGTTNIEWARTQYSAGVAYADLLLERTDKALRGAGLLSRAVWAVTADHGESLGERNSWFNHRGLFPEVTRVPLILNGLGSSGSNSEPVSTLDIAQTLLQAAGGSSATMGRGENLSDTRAPESKRTIWFEHASNHQVGCRSGPWYFVTTISDDMSFGLEVVVDDAGRKVPKLPNVPKGTHFLFNLEQDPELTTNLAEREPDVVDSFLRELEIWRASAEGMRSDLRAMTPEEIAELGALGYADQVKGKAPKGE